MEEEPIGKTCAKCGIEKPLNDFHNHKNGKHGRQAECKSCKAIRAKEYSDAKAKENLKLNIDTSTATRVCTICSTEKVLDEFYKDKKGKLGRTVDCKSCVKERTRKWSKANRDRVSAASKEWYKKNKDRAIAYSKAYREANKDKRNEHQKERLKNDPIFKLKKNSRTRVNTVLRRGGYTKKSKTQEMLGIDWERFQKHLESTFTEGMTWDNYGEWHVDHITPLASANTEEELIKLLHYSNTQALWAEENLAKSDRILEPTQVKLSI